MVSTTVPAERTWIVISRVPDRVRDKFVATIAAVPFQDCQITGRFPSCSALMWFRIFQRS